MRDYMLSHLRNKSIYAPIDPPLSKTVCVAASFADGEQVVPVPSWARMYRITFMPTSAAMCLLVSQDRGVQLAAAVSQDVNCISGNAGQWRKCEGVAQLVLKTIDVGGRVYTSIEFSRGY